MYLAKKIFKWTKSSAPSFSNFVRHIFGTWSHSNQNVKDKFKYITLFSISISGSVYRSKLATQAFKHSVSKIFVHRNYNDTIVPTEDIALLKLKYPVAMSMKVKTIKLATKRIADKHITKMKCHGAGKDTFRMKSGHFIFRYLHFSIL